MLNRLLRADFIKMKRTSVFAAHVWIPILISMLFLAYAGISSWNEYTLILAYYQLLGAALPVLIGIFAASLMEQERGAGGFFHMLSIPHKWMAMCSKLLVLLLLGLFALLFAGLVFGIGICGGKDAVACLNSFLCASLILWLGSIPLYIWQLLLAFSFGSGVSIAAGLLSGLLSALLQTGLGEAVWSFVVPSWSARLVQQYLQAVCSGVRGAYNLQPFIMLYACVIGISLWIFLRWACRFEGGSRIE